ncbi:MULTISPECIES: YjfB family protein [unclassified Planococcus (in: firmicutes)]|uniref:YjfB family protein n=1 Tax=unclassified Planococcus (in: firmicutes) TaxID=2662419 RepID=UPI0011B7345B|nr:MULTISPECIES: YjfB family protein [unclassified Planococcus (in: firmicutes)]TWT04486.1 putative motility protein [Planococcus sp. CPCC 101016]
MDIGALSMAISQINVRTEVNVSIMKKTINQAETNGQSVVKMLGQFVQPHIGGKLDIRG